MDRYEKTNKIKELEKLIKDKKEKISLEEIALANLETELRKIHNNSDIPILLFIIDETLPLPEDIDDYRYEYIYYCPDIDEVKSIIEHTDNKFLPNTVDMRKFFEKVDIPGIISPRRMTNQYDKLNYIVLYLKTVINNIFATHDIDNWSDLAHFLKGIPHDYTNNNFLENEIKGKTKTLKPRD